MTLLPSLSRNKAHYMLGIGVETRINVYYSYSYIYTCNIAKKIEGKGSGMSGTACSSLGMMSTTLADDV